MRKSRMKAAIDITTSNIVADNAPSGSEQCNNLSPVGPNIRQVTTRAAVKLLRIMVSSTKFRRFRAGIGVVGLEYIGSVHTSQAYWKSVAPVS